MVRAAVHTPIRRRGAPRGNTYALKAGTHTADVRAHRAVALARLAAIKRLLGEVGAELELCNALDALDKHRKQSPQYTDHIAGLRSLMLRAEPDAPAVHRVSAPRADTPGPTLPTDAVPAQLTPLERTGPRRLDERFLADLQDHWEIHGKSAIQQAYDHHLPTYMRVMASVAPKQAQARPAVSDTPAVEPERIESIARPSWGDALTAYRPYPKQAAFHKGGREHSERLLMAGNQLGKTMAGAMEWAMHLTGRYPNWWKGAKFAYGGRYWAAGETVESTRDTVQRLLVGPPEQSELWGSGAIPHDAIVDVQRARGVPNAIDSVTVRHDSGNLSTLLFKSYEKGREKWQGETLNGVWFDEEPPYDIYMEGLTRTNATGGLAMVTFTPLKGMSKVVNLYFNDADLQQLRSLAGERVPIRCGSPDPVSGAMIRRMIVFMTIDDVEHYSPEQRAIVVARYAPHEREARLNGIPVLGSGRIFAVEEERIRIEPIAIPAHWPQIIGLDFGYDHPFAAVHCAYDREADCFYICKEYREREATPHVHAATVVPWGNWIPSAWPHDGLQHDKGGSCEQLASQYRTRGLNMLAQYASFADGTNGVEAGILDMLERMQTGRWKVFSNCGMWFGEFRLYHRNEGRIVKIQDDLISASRYALMMKRFAITYPQPKPRRERHNPWEGVPHAWMR